MTPHKPCIQIINGPNIATLGLREPELYGTLTYQDLAGQIQTHAEQHQCTVSIFQHNAEHALIDCIHQARGTYQGLIINLGAFTHTSIALRDALLFSQIPFIEVHISNVFARESFRHKSFMADKAEGVIAGMGVHGYLMAMDYFICTHQKGMSHES